MITGEWGPQIAMNYKTIASGSSGNCVVINDVMIDCGVSFKDLSSYLYDIKYLILTHIHADHVKLSTLKTIKKLFPRITIIGNYEIHQKFRVHKIANAEQSLIVGDYEFLPFLCEHDVLTYGFTWKYGDISILYATDTGSMSNAPDGIYDYLFIESNHCEKKLELARGQVKGGYNPYTSGKRHLSTQQAKAFYYLHRRNKDSEFIELHKSKKFY